MVLMPDQITAGYFKQEENGKSKTSQGIGKKAKQIASKTEKRTIFRKFHDCCCLF